MTLRRWARACVLGALAFSACVGGRATPVGVAAGSRSLDGAAILERTCATCHDLGGLTAYSDYWGEPEWRSMVETMIGYGARLTPEEVSALSRYLAVEYGTAAGP